MTPFLTLQYGAVKALRHCKFAHKSNHDSSNTSTSRQITDNGLPVSGPAGAVCLPFPTQTLLGCSNLLRSMRDREQPEVRYFDTSPPWSIPRAALRKHSLIWRYLRTSETTITSWGPQNGACVQSEDNDKPGACICIWKRVWKFSSGFLHWVNYKPLWCMKMDLATNMSGRMKNHHQSHFTWDQPMWWHGFALYLYSFGLLGVSNVSLEICHWKIFSGYDPQHCQIKLWTEPIHQNVLYICYSDYLRKKVFVKWTYWWIFKENGPWNQFLQTLAIYSISQWLWLREEFNQKQEILMIDMYDVCLIYVCDWCCIKHMNGFYCWKCMCPKVIFWFMRKMSVWITLIRYNGYPMMIEDERSKLVSIWSELYWVMMSEIIWDILKVLMGLLHQ